MRNARPALPVYRRWLPLTAAATIVFAVAAVFGLGLNQKAHALAVQATVDHVKCARFSVPRTAEDPVQAAERWHARFGWPIKVPPSSADAGLELRGVRRCAVIDGRVAHLMYQWRGQPLSVYVLPTRLFGESAELVHRLGHHAIIWSQHDRTYMVVANRAPGPALDRVVAYVKANAY